MKLHDYHFTQIYNTEECGEHACIIGVAWGRVHYPYTYQPEDNQFNPSDRGWLYSLRLLILCWKLEILWRTRG